MPELVGLGVELIEQPFPARAVPRPALAPGALVDPDRGRRERRDRSRTSTRSSASSRASTSSSPSAAASDPATADARARARARVPDLPRLHGGDVGRDRGSAAVASLADWVDLDGSLLLADDPFEGLELGRRPPLDPPRRPGLGLTAAVRRR